MNLLQMRFGLFLLFVLLSNVFAFMTNVYALRLMLSTYFFSGSNYFFSWNLATWSSVLPWPAWYWSYSGNPPWQDQICHPAKWRRTIRNKKHSLQRSLASTNPSTSPTQSGPGWDRDCHCSSYNWPWLHWSIWWYPWRYGHWVATVLCYVCLMIN